VYWEMQLENIEDTGMFVILESHKVEENSQFFKFIDKNYPPWFAERVDEAPVMSHTVFRAIVVPEMIQKLPTLINAIDNLRLDQWRAFEPIIASHYKKEHENTFYSILPTATQYARNAIFSGMMPLEMEKRFPQYWKNDTDEGGKNLYEAEFLQAQ